MKKVSAFNSLFYTGLFMIITPLLIIVLMGIFGNSMPGPKSKQNVVVVDTAHAPVIKVLPKPVVIDSVKPIEKPKKKKIEAVIDSVKIKEVKVDSLILNKDSI